MVFPLGIALAGIEMQQPTLARTVPNRDRCGGSNRRRSPVHRVESASACVLPRGAGTRTHASGGCRHCLATWAAPSASTAATRVLV